MNLCMAAQYKERNVQYRPIALGLDLTQSIYTLAVQLHL